MKKRTVLVCVLLLLAFVAAEAAVVKVKVATANVRAKPDLMASVISRVSQGALLEVQNKIGAWYEIQVVDNAGNTVTGYISQDVVEEVGGAAAPAKPAAAAPVQAPAAAAPAPASTGYAALPPAPSAGGLFVAAGPVLSNLSFSEDLEETKKSPRFGLAAGVGYEMPIGQGFSLLPSIIFTTAGTVLSEGDNKMKYIANAVVAPILVKFDVGGGPYIVAGPYLGYVLSPKMTFTNGGETEEYDIESDKINSFQMGLTFGGGYEMALGSSRLAVQLTYGLGITKLNKEGDDTVKPTSINLMVLFKL